MAEKFNLNQRAAEVVRAPFEFVWGPNDQEWSMKNAFKLDLDVVVAAIESSDMESIRRAMREAMGPEQWKRFAKEAPLDLDAAKLLFNAWLDHGGMDPGESSGSSTSSAESTAEPSNQTSTTSTASASGTRSTARKRAGTRRAS